MPFEGRGAGSGAHASTRPRETVGAVCVCDAILSRHGRVAPVGAVGTACGVASSATFASAARAGKDPVIAVPRPGIEATASVPPSAASRSAIPCSPVP